MGKTGKLENWYELKCFFCTENKIQNTKFLYYPSCLYTLPPLQPLSICPSNSVGVSLFAQSARSHKSCHPPQLTQHSTSPVCQLCSGHQGEYHHSRMLVTQQPLCSLSVRPLLRPQPEAVGLPKPLYDPTFACREQSSQLLPNFSSLADETSPLLLTRRSLHAQLLSNCSATLAQSGRCSNT